MAIDDPNLAVVFLARQHEGGIAAVEAFLKHYSEYPPGCGHTLYFAVKGWVRGPARETLTQLAEGCGATLVELPDDGFDWGAYFRIATMLQQTWVCFLNTHSRPVSPDWLRKIYLAAQAPDVGMVGATGSWESLARFDSSSACGLGVLPRMRRFISSLLNRHKFAAFPNAHLRSNGCLIRRELFLAFAAGVSMPTDKKAALLLESGHNGLSAFVRKQGLELMVVGANGQHYSREAWADSETFRSGAQANLLVEDNQTRDYMTAAAREKSRLAALAWGNRCLPIV